MEGFVGVRGVIEPRRLRELGRRSDLRGWIQTTSHLGAAAACTTALVLTWGTWWAVPFFLLQGLLINMFYAGEHECDHGTVFTSPTLNRWVAHVFGFWILLPSDYHKWSHFAHHRHTQDWEKDTEILDRRPFDSAWHYVWMLSGLLYYVQRVRLVLRLAGGSAPEWYLTTRQRRQVIVSARWHLAGYAAIAASAVALGSWWPVTYWLGPLVCMHWSYRLQGTAEHTGLTHAPNTLLNTRTLKTNAFMRWLHWNMTYHTVHHTYPAVPFHALPLLHREVAARYPYALPTSGFFRVHWEIIRALADGKTELDICAETEARQVRRATA